MKLTYQDYGSSILLFVNALNNKEAYGKYLSLWNWNCTSSEPDYVSDGVIAVWSTKEKLQEYLFNIRLMQLANLSPKYGVKGGVAAEAKQLSEQDFLAVEQEMYRSIGNNYDFHTLGTISAEKPDDDLKDYFVNKAFANA